MTTARLVVVLGLTAIFVISCVFSNPLGSWDVSTARLPIGDRQQSIAYDSTSTYPNCIFVIGGNNCPTCVYCFDINTYTISTWDTLTVGTYASEIGSAVMFGDIIYYKGPFGDQQLYTYNIVSKVQTPTPTAAFHFNTCIVRHPTNTDRIFFHNHFYNEFSYYSISGQTFAIGSSPIYDRTFPSCVMNDYNGTPYMYIIGGDSSYIERINLDTPLTSNWETFSTTLDNIPGASVDFAQSYYMAVATSGKYIYLIGGIDENGSSHNNVISLNVADQTIEYVNQFPFNTFYHRAIGVNGCIYVFGNFESLYSSTIGINCLSLTTTTPTPSVLECPLKISDECDEIANCFLWQTNKGCVKCNNGYFKTDSYYQCTSCQDLFGRECLFCRDNEGCVKCNSGYKLTYDTNCGLNYCNQHE